MTAVTVSGWVSRGEVQFKNVPGITHASYVDGFAGDAIRDRERFVPCANGWYAARWWKDASAPVTCVWCLAWQVAIGC